MRHCSAGRESGRAAGPGDGSSVHPLLEFVLPSRCVVGVRMDVTAGRQVHQQLLEILATGPGARSGYQAGHSTDSSPDESYQGSLMSCVMSSRVSLCPEFYQDVPPSAKARLVKFKFRVRFKPGWS